MIRGTTTTFKFEIPSNISNLSGAGIEAVFWQQNNNNLSTAPIRKTNAVDGGIVVSGREAIVALSPSDTERFSSDIKGYAQIKITCAGNNCYASYPKRFTVYPIHAELIDVD